VNLSPSPAVARPTPGLATLGRLARGYSRIFAESRIADRLSPTHPLCRTGFDTRLEIVQRDEVAADVVALTLSRADSTELPTWTPGAHIDVFTPSGRQRHYSLIGDTSDRSRYRIAVRLVPNGIGSAELHRLEIGDGLRVRGPRNAFHLAHAPDYVFVAGGIGITPILPMIRRVAADGQSWRLVYTGRSRDTMPFVDELASLGRDRVEIRPDDEFGVPDVESLLVGMGPATALYVCGPAPMIERTRNAALRVNDLAEIHSERFGAPPVVDGQPFSVVLAASGVTVDVGAGESALDAIRRARPDVRYSCQQGFCGACRVRVLHGAVDHRDRVLTPAERADTMTICVSRASSDSLVIDL
jgi:ferredoxin-NADP reductase